MVPAGFPNRVLAAAGWDAGAAVAVVPEVLVSVDLGAPSPENKPEPPAAGVDDGVVEEVAPPRDGNIDF